MNTKTTTPKQALMSKAKDMGLKINSKMNMETIANLIDEAKKGKEKAKISQEKFNDEY